jgi:phosphoglycerate dehydrogenase-like enzyme
MLSLARKLPEAERAFARASIGVPVGIELGGKVLGLVGRGQSGSALARIAAALGMEVVSVGSSSQPGALYDLLSRADVVSIHCPLTPKTRGLFDDQAFARMKPGAYLINCARGGIVDRGALERALESGRLGGVGLDVHWNEPWDPGDPLYAREDVVALPHIAGSTEEAFGRLADLVAGNIARVARGEPPLHRIA